LTSTSRRVRGGATRVASALLVGLLAGLPIGCGTTVSSSQPSATASSSSATGDLPDLGLAKVKTETAAARGATIGPDGGTVSATGSNGAVYTLSLPPDAVTSDTQIALYPVDSLADAPGGAPITAGVQLSPDGLRLRAPATLTMELPSGMDATKLVALAWGGDAVDVHRYPSITTGNSVAMTIVHFSGYADTEKFNAEVAATAANAHYEDLLLLRWQLRESKAELRDDLRTWYQAVVKPALAGAEIESVKDPLDVKDSDLPDAEYSSWLEALDWARQVTGDSAFTVAPELTESVGLAATFLRDWYLAENAECLKRADDINTAGPLFWAERAIDDASYRAFMYSVLSDIIFSTAANYLDQQTLLDGLCVKVVIDQDRSYSATKPAETGTLTVRAGFQIGTGPVRYGVPAYPIWVEGNVRSGSEFEAFELGEDGRGSVDGLLWPAGVDPVQVDILATLTELASLSPTSIQRFDRITKSARAKESHSGAIQDVRAPDVVGYCQPFDATAYGQGGTPVGGVLISGNILSTFSITSGPATITAQQGSVAPGTLDANSGWVKEFLPIYATFLSGHAAGTIVLTSTSVHPAGTGTAVISVVPLLGLFQGTDAGQPLVLEVDARLSVDSEITYTAVATGGGPSLTWMVPGQADALRATDALGLTGHPLDLRLDGDHLVGDLDGSPVDLVRQCPGPFRHYLAADD
jgi:hypothetical protein